MLIGVRPELVRETAVLLGKVRHLWRGLRCWGSKRRDRRVEDRLVVNHTGLFSIVGFKHPGMSSKGWLPNRSSRPESVVCTRHAAVVQPGGGDCEVGAVYELHVCGVVAVETAMP